MRQALRSIVWLFLVIAALNTVGCSDDPSSEPDTTPPTLDEVLVNEGTPYALARTVTVTASCSDNEGVAAIMISEDADLTDGVWQDYQAEVSFELSAGDGSKVLYAKVKDESGNESTVLSAEVVLAESTTIIGLTPYGSNHVEQQATTLELWVANVSNMYSGVFQLSFDPELVEVSLLEVDFSNHILRSTGIPIYVTPVHFNNETGEVKVGAISNDPDPETEGITGSGPFARITFTPKQSLSSSAAIEFVEGDWTEILVIPQPGLPPIPSNDFLLIDGEIEP